MNPKNIFVAKIYLRIYYNDTTNNLLPRNKSASLTVINYIWQITGRGGQSVGIAISYHIINFSAYPPPSLLYLCHLTYGLLAV